MAADIILPPRPPRPPTRDSALGAVVFALVLACIAALLVYRRPWATERRA